MHWVRKQFWKHALYANLKKCCFYQNKICFLGFVVLAQEINIEKQKIEVFKIWPEPNSTRGI